MWRSIALLVSAAVAVAGCRARSATAPSPGAPRLTLEAGAQWLVLVGLNVAGGDVPPCAPLATPLSGTSIETPVVVSYDAPEWIVRSASVVAGTIDMRFREVPAEFARVDVEGSIQGVGRDIARPPFKPFVTATRAIFGETGAMVVKGSGELFSSYAGGQMFGPMRFADNDGQSGYCTAILWSLIAAAPSEVGLWPSIQR